MTRPLLFIAVCLPMLSAWGQAPDRTKYQSPYSVKFDFAEDALIGDLISGQRANWKEQSSVDFREWYNPLNQTRWGYRGPPTKHYEAPDGLGQKSVEWLRQRIIATGLRYVGYSYQHHHCPDWDPPESWPRNPDQKTPVGKGLDCSNFSAFVYNLALGIKPTSDVRLQAELREVPGPGARRTSPVKRIELPESYSAFQSELLTGDLLFVNNRSGKLSHVVLWVGEIGQSPDGTPLILDSTGVGNFDHNGTEIPDGIYLRLFEPNTWYFTQASHILRIIPDGQ